MCSLSLCPSISTSFSHPLPPKLRTRPPSRAVSGNVTHVAQCDLSTPECHCSAGECDPQNGQGNVTLGMGAWLAPVLCVDGMQKERTTRRDNARHGTTRLSTARHSTAWYVRHGMAHCGTAPPAGSLRSGAASRGPALLRSGPWGRQPSQVKVPLFPDQTRL